MGSGKGALTASLLPSPVSIVAMAPPAAPLPPPAALPPPEKLSDEGTAVGTTVPSPWVRSVASTGFQPPSAAFTRSTVVVASVVSVPRGVAWV